MGSHNYLQDFKMGDFETEADIIFNESVSNMEEHQCISRINSRCTDDSMPFILQETVEEDEEFEQETFLLTW